VYDELVEAGLLESDPAGPAAVQEEYAADYCQPWLACMFDGGGPTTCGAPMK
jgi:hypothetical protein